MKLNRHARAHLRRTLDARLFLARAAGLTPPPEPTRFWLWLFATQAKYEPYLRRVEQARSS